MLSQSSNTCTSIVIAGQYALAVCELPVAANRFLAAEKCSSSHSQARLACIHGALTLVASNKPHDYIRAAEILQRHQLWAETDAVLPYHDRCSCDVSVGQACDKFDLATSECPAAVQLSSGAG